MLGWEDMKLLGHKKAQRGTKATLPLAIPVRPVSLHVERMCIISAAVAGFEARATRRLSCYLFGKEMNPLIPLVVSVLALVVSGVTAWLTLLRRGRLRMTQPTTIFLGEDGGGLSGQRVPVKVYLRTLLFSTSRRGQTVESLHLNVQRGDTNQNFSIWVYGEEKLSRGSGLHVGFQGVVCNHHFLLPKDGADFRFLAGDYIIRVFAKLVEERSSKQLAEIRLQVSDLQARELVEPMAGIHFDWSPDQQKYHSHVARRK